MCNQMEMICDFTTDEEAKVKQEYLELKEILENNF